MDNGIDNQAIFSTVFFRAGLPIIIAWLLLFLAYFIALIDSTREPFADLGSKDSHILYLLSQSGGTTGTTIIAVLMLALLLIYGRVTSKRQILTIGIMILIVAGCIGGGAFLNEFIIKEQLKVPRPNIIALAGENGSGPLGMTPEEFYGSGGKVVRSKLLAEVLNSESNPVSLIPSIKTHWIKETGYSFPSGHSFASMSIATFFLFLSATYLSMSRLWPFYFLLPWAVAVCYSRSILRVHTPTDIVVGGFIGLMVGLIAWIVTRKMTRRRT